MKNVLVTGGNGFIGGYVQEGLAARGYSPWVYDRRAMAHLETQGFFGDIKDATMVFEAVGHVDGVIHLAGVLGTQETIKNPVPAAETNILGGLNVIMACKQYDVPLVNIAVGNWWMDNTYSITKNTVERLVRMTAMYEGAVMTSVRALNAYGPRQAAVPPWGSSRVRKIMPSFCCKALSGEPIEIYGDGSQVMDMIYVSDVADVLIGALEAMDAGITFERLEAGTGIETTVKQIAEEVISAVASATGTHVEIDELPMRPGEDPGSVVLADPGALPQIGVDPASFVSLATGVAATVKYFKEYLSL